MTSSIVPSSFNFEGTDLEIQLDEVTGEPWFAASKIGGIMDVKWKDGAGNILNANKEKIIYLDIEENKKTIIKNEEVKKITIEDGLMNIFVDFNNDLALTIIIPKKNKRDAVKIFNEYDKTGTMLKRKSNNFLLNLILESSMVAGNPFLGIAAIIFIVAILLLTLTNILNIAFGDAGIIIVRILVFSLIAYAIISRVLVRMKRKKIAEKK